MYTQINKKCLISCLYMGRGFKEEVRLTFWKRLTGQQKPSLSRKIASILIGVLFVLGSVGVGVFFSDNLRSYYVHWIYRNEPITINVLSIYRQYSATHVVLTDNTPIPVGYSGFVGSDIGCIDGHITSMRPIAITDDDRVVTAGDFCLFAFIMGYRGDKRNMLIPLSISQPILCSDCNENLVAIQHYGTKPITNFFARVCTAGGVIKTVEGEHFKKSSDNCIEINLPVLNPGQLITGKFSIVDFSGKSVELSFEGFSVEQGEISQSNFIRTGAILLENCDATGLVNNDRKICANPT